MKFSASLPILFLLQLVVGLPNSTRAQTKADILWGEQLKIPKGENLDCYSFGPELYLQVWNRGSNLNLYSITRNMNLIKPGVVNIEHAKKPGRWTVKRIFRLADNLAVLTQIDDKKGEKVYFFIQLINSRTLLVESEPKLVHERSTEKNSPRSIILSQTSEDAQTWKLLLRGKEENGHAAIELLEFDANLELINTTDYEFDSEKLGELSRFHLHDDGNLAVLGTKELDKGSVEKEQSRTTYQLGICRDDSYVYYDLESHAHFMTDISIRFKPNQDVVVAGFYGVKSSEHVNGAFYFGESQEEERIRITQFHEFPIEEVTRFHSEKNEKKARKKEEKGKEIELKEFNLEYVFFKDDGLYLIGEQAWIDFQTYVDANGYTRTSTHYFNLDILTMKFDDDGNILWMTRIPKNNYSSNDEGKYGSFSAAFSEDAFHFVYNDHIDNITELNPKNVRRSPRGGPEAYTVVATLDLEGELTREALFSISDASSYTRVNNATAISNDEEVGFMLYSTKKKLKFCKVIVEKH